MTTFNKIIYEFINSFVIIIIIINCDKSKFAKHSKKKGITYFINSIQYINCVVIKKNYYLHEKIILN